MKRRNVTMNDIAKKAGVSQSTVSIVMHGNQHSTISTETVEMVLKAADSLNYNYRKRDIHASNSGVILVLESDQTSPFYSYTYQEIERAAREHNLYTLACNTYHNATNEKAYLNMAIDQKMLAVVFLYPPDNFEVIHKVKLHMPVIAICDKISDQSVDLIELNNFQAGQIAVDHLLSLGHKNIVLLTTRTSSNLARVNRVNGIKYQMKTKGLLDELTILSDEKNLNDSNYSIDNDYQAGLQFSKCAELNTDKNTAIIAINDMLAIGVIDGLHKEGFEVPSDYSLIGFDNLMLTGLSRISLTTVDHRTELLTQAAVNLLMNRLQPAPSLMDNTRYKVECLPRLIVRESTAKHSD